MSRITAEDEDEYGGAEVPRQGYGNVNFNGSTKLVMWLLGVFGGVMTALLIAVLNAVYTQNGELHELKQWVKDVAEHVDHLDGHGRT